MHSINENLEAKYLRESLNDLKLAQANFKEEFKEHYKHEESAFRNILISLDSIKDSIVELKLSSSEKRSEMYNILTSTKEEILSECNKLYETKEESNFKFSSLRREAYLVWTLVITIICPLLYFILKDI